MHLKYPVFACALALIGASCTASVAPTPTPTAAPTVTATAAPTPSASPTAGVGSPIAITAVSVDRAWHTVPDGLFADPAVVTVDFASDPSAAAPKVRMAAQNFPLAPTATPTRWTASLDLKGISPSVYSLTYLERVAGSDTFVPGPAAAVRISQPEYVVWTLDFEGDESSDATMANTAAISDGLKVPMTILWNPRAWTSTQVSAARADAMLAWTKDRGAKGDEIGLHLHMWTDYVRSAGVSPRTSPSWAARLDGYDVPITAYSEEEQAKLIAYGLRLMADHGLAGITSFRAGGDFGDAATLRSLVANGITADCTAVPAGTFGSLRWPWTLAADAQPYRPSREDANKPGDLPILEAPTQAGNTYGYTSTSIAGIVRADLALLAKPGEVATARKGLTVVSHPGTIDATERAAIETLFRALDPLRYDRDSGPVRFITLRQLAAAWR